MEVRFRLTYLCVLTCNSVITCTGSFKRSVWVSCHYKPNYLLLSVSNLCLRDPGLGPPDALGCEPARQYWTMQRSCAEGLPTFQDALAKWLLLAQVVQVTLHARKPTWAQLSITEIMPSPCTSAHSFFSHHTIARVYSGNQLHDSDSRTPRYEMQILSARLIQIDTSQPHVSSHERSH
jgi:hypothetical protein